MLFNMHSHSKPDGTKGGSGYKYDKYDPWNSVAKSWLNIQSGERIKNIIHPKKVDCHESRSKNFHFTGGFCLQSANFGKLVN